MVERDDRAVRVAPAEVEDRQADVRAAVDDLRRGAQVDRVLAAEEHLLEQLGERVVA
jgi:hypothetical protein